jgi:hypothetical protein
MTAEKIFFRNFFLSSRKILPISPPPTAAYDPFVYRLGLQIFILARRVQLPYGSPARRKALFSGRNQMIFRF